MGHTINLGDTAQSEAPSQHDQHAYSNREEIKAYSEDLGVIVNWFEGFCMT